MKKAWKYFVAVVLPVSGLSALFTACSTTQCNNDACYDRNLSSADPYKRGDVAAWGTEKQIADEENEREAKETKRLNRPDRNR